MRVPVLGNGMALGLSFVGHNSGKHLGLWLTVMELGN